MKVIALVDGEHYPSVTRWGLSSARAAGYEVLAALMLGGVEKLDAEGRLDLGSVPVMGAGRDPREALERAIADHLPEAVLDLSDEPVLDYRRRMWLVAVALARGVAYVGSDFRFDPPVVDDPLPVTTVGVIGTGKRVAKTAIAGHVARLAAAWGDRPYVVAMGRGGPPGPETAGPDDVRVEALLDRAARGHHAASDFLEDALTAGVPTVGARRCGGGLAGRPFVTNVAEAADLAVSSGAGMVILEGSGASMPTVPWDAGVLVIPSVLPEEYLAGYLGPLRVLLSDLAVLIIDGGSLAGPANLSSLESQLRGLHTDIRVAITELQPVPLEDVRDKDVFLATTAQHDVAERLASRLERERGCRVVKASVHLSDRARLERDLDTAPPFDVLVTELKAAAIDVAARRAVDRGARVVFMDNRPVGVGGDGELDELIRETVALARDRAANRGPEARTVGA